MITPNSMAEALGKMNPIRNVRFSVNGDELVSFIFISDKKILWFLLPVSYFMLYTKNAN